MTQSTELTKTQMAARIAELETKVADASKPRSLSCKVGAKGGLSVYGLNARFPVTLYAAQWERLIAYMPTVESFIAEHNGDLARK